MNFFSNNPFVKILGFWIIGLLIAKYFPVLLPAIIILSVAAGGWFLFLRRHKRYPFDLVASALLALIILLLSSLNFILQRTPVPLAPDHETKFVATVLENPQVKANSYQTILAINQATEDYLNGLKVITWLQKDSSMLDIHAGDQIFVTTTIQPIENSGNPFEFDYKSYMAQQDIYFRCYISRKNLEFTNHHSRGLNLWAENFRSKLLEQLHAGLSKQQNFEVVSALTLGYRRELSPETRYSFSSTGAMHVLAVSGLHVGLIYLFLLRIFSFLNLLMGGKWYKLILISALLWAYALITGFSPSVQRATIMFTILLVAETLNRRNSIYNSIATSAFVLLLIDPNILFAVGFQLSYAAVLSIVYFYPILSKLITTENLIVQKPWQLFCVSIAAQIGTLPLSLYYFHQFPVYFWLSNFVVIPAAFILLCVTFFFFISIPLLPVHHLFARVLDMATSAMLFLLNQISDLPGALVNHIAITNVELISLVLLILFTILFIQIKRPRYLHLALSCLLLFQVAGFVVKLRLFNQHHTIIYKNPSSTIHLISGRNNYLLCSDTSKLSPYLYSNVITELQLEDPVIIPVFDTTTFANSTLLLRGDICQFGDQTILLDTLDKYKRFSNSSVQVKDTITPSPLN